MRIRDLRLVRYGNFENRMLDFPLVEGAPDFHLIYGPNEAGKSTTLEAVNDFLFGFPFHKSQDYRFDASLLRVGATVEEGETVAALYRRRGRSDTLRDEFDAAAQVGPLAAMLRGQTREGFRLSWSLDHLRLREGGKAIVEARNDVGQAIFAAGAGLGSIPKLLEELDAAADEIWGERASTKRTYARAEREYHEACESERKARVKPSDWRAANERYDELGQSQQAREGARRALQEQLRKTERIRRIAAPALRLDHVAVEIAAFEGVWFSETEEATHEAGVRAIAKSTAERDVAARLLAEEQDRLAAIEIDEEMQSVAHGVVALSERRLQIAEAMRDRAMLTTSLAAKEEALADLFAEAGLTELQDSTDAAALLPPRHVVETLRRKAKFLDEANAARSQIGETKAETERNRSRLAARLQAFSPVEGAEQLRATVAAAHRAGDLDRDLLRATAAVRDAESSCGIALGRLKPWSGDLATLRAAVSPSDSEIDDQRASTESTVSTIREQRRRVAELDDRTAQLALKRTQLASTRTAVSLQVLAEARADRDQKWTAVRRAVLDRKLLADAPEAVSGLEQSIGFADKVADARFASADASAQLSAIEDEHGRIDLETRQLTASLEELVSSAEQSKIRWYARLAANGLPCLEPTALRAWLERRGTALAEYTMADEARAHLEEIRSTAEALLVDLITATPPDFAAPKSATFSTNLAAAQSALEAMVTRAAERAQLEAALRNAEEATVAAAERMSAKDAEIIASVASLAKDLERAGLTGRGDTAALDVYDRLRGALAAANSDRKRINEITEAEERFRRDVAAIVGNLGFDDAKMDAFEVMRTLERRLTASRTTLAQFEQCERVLATRETQYREAKAVLDAQTANLAPLMAKASAETMETLASAITASKVFRGLQQEQSSLKATIEQEGDGLPLEALLAEWRSADIDRLAELSAKLADELEAVAAEITKIADSRGEARKTLDALDRGPDAAKAAADAALARAEMDVQAEAYLLRRAQAVILRWAIERHREKFQSPLLARAKILFQRLTLGNYIDLQVDDAREAQRIVGVRIGGERTVPVEAMSDGTVDQLFLSLRLAALEHSVANGVAMPFLADDLFINFDDERSSAGLSVLAEVANSTQIIFFTHHRGLIDLARGALGNQLQVHELVVN